MVVPRILFRVRSASVTENMGGRPPQLGPPIPFLSPRVITVLYYTLSLEGEEARIFLANSKLTSNFLVGYRWWCYNEMTREYYTVRLGHTVGWGQNGLNKKYKRGRSPHNIDIKLGCCRNGRWGGGRRNHTNKPKKVLCTFPGGGYSRVRPMEEL